MAGIAGRDDSTIIQDAGIVPLLAWFTIAGIVVYVILVTIAQLLPPHYSAIHDAESDLAVGKYGYLMTTAFVLRGIFSFALLAALTRALPPAAKSRWGMRLLGVFGVGAFLLAIFEADVPSSHHTLHGGIHLLVALLAFICVAVAQVLLSRGFRTTDWSAISKTILSTLSYWTAFTLVLFLILSGRPRVFGLFERLFIGSALLWMFVVAVRLILSHAPAQQPSSATS